MLREFRVAAVLAASLALSGCGIKGPLYLPPQATPAPATPTPPPAATAPASPPAVGASAPTAATPAEASGTTPKKP